MRIRDLPRHPSDLLAELRSAQRSGPSGIARLAALCLWFVGRRDDPRATYAGLEGLKPLNREKTGRASGARSEPR